MTNMFPTQFTYNTKTRGSVGSLFVMKKGRDEFLRAFIARFRMANTNLRDLNPDTALEAYKAGIADKFIGKILSSHQNLTLSEAYQVTLSIVKLNEIRERQAKNGK